MRARARGRGYTLDESTRAMGMALERHPSAARRSIELASPDWAELPAHRRRAAGLPRAAPTPTPSTSLVARLDGESVATALAFDHDGDCGIYNVGDARARPPARPRHRADRAPVHDAAARGCRTASLQSTAMAERVYAAVGFRDLGRILEYVAVAVRGVARRRVEHDEPDGLPAASPARERQRHGVVAVHDWLSCRFYTRVTPVQRAVAVRDTGVHRLASRERPWHRMRHPRRRRSRYA